MESKAVIGQKTFGGQRGLFVGWMDKMRNAIAGSNPELRAVMEWAEDTCSKMGEEKCNMMMWNEHRAELCENLTDQEEWEWWEEGLWGVLIDKTEGEARSEGEGKGSKGVGKAVEVVHEDRRIGNN